MFPPLLNSGFTRLKMKLVRFGQAGATRWSGIAPALEVVLVEGQARGTPAALRTYPI